MKKTGWALIALLAVILIAEAGLRFCNRMNPLFVFHDDGYGRLRGKPFAPDYDVTLNSSGFKDVEYPLEKGDRCRILGIGGSFTFGTIPYRFNYLTLLEEELNREGGRFEVINMGMPSAGPRDFVSILLHEGLALDPDLVLLSFFTGSDFLESKRKAVSYSHLASFLQHLVRPRGEHEGRVVHGERAYRDDEPTLSRERFLEVEFFRGRVFRKGWGRFSRRFRDAVHHLEEARKICEAHGARLAVVIIPDELQLDPALQAEFLAAEGATPGQFDFNLPDRRLARRLAEMKIDTLDLMGPFARASRHERLYKLYDTHWNIAGNRLAAEQIRDFLESRVLPRTCPGLDR